MNYSVIIKRLELIKNLIALEELDLISEQIYKLTEFESVYEVNQICKLLTEKHFGQAVEGINQFLKSQKQIIKYEDAEIEALKLEIKYLEKSLNVLSYEEADLEKLIHEFGRRHNMELGYLILKILNNRRNIAKGTPIQEETEEDYEKYNQQFITSKEEVIAKLPPEVQRELKEKYRKASKLCHPDVVCDSQKELATRIFAELNEAYAKSNIDKVKEILESLERESFFLTKSDTINQTGLLKIEIKKLNLLIQELTNKIFSIKESETYKTIMNIDDWDEYFRETKEKLQIQVDTLTN